MMMIFGRQVSRVIRYYAHAAGHEVTHYFTGRHMSYCRLSARKHFLYDAYFGRNRNAYRPSAKYHYREDFCATCARAAGDYADFMAYRRRPDYLPYRKRYAKLLYTSHDYALISIHATPTPRRGRECRPAPMPCRPQRHYRPFRAMSQACHSAFLNGTGTARRRISRRGDTLNAPNLINKINTEYYVRKKCRHHGAIYWLFAHRAELRRRPRGAWHYVAHIVINTSVITRQISHRNLAHYSALWRFSSDTSPSIDNVISRICLPMSFHRAHEHAGGFRLRTYAQMSMRCA